MLFSSETLAVVGEVPGEVGRGVGLQGVAWTLMTAVCRCLSDESESMGGCEAQPPVNKPTGMQRSRA